METKWWDIQDLVGNSFARDSVHWWHSVVGVPLEPWQEEILMRWDERPDRTLGFTVCPEARQWQRWWNGR